MKEHLFLFKPGLWIGEGKISFASSTEKVHFFTRWQLMDQTPDSILWLQEVELHGLEQTTRNLFTFSEIKGKNFKVELSNDLMRGISGKGIIGEEAIAWELRDRPNSEGYEIYELQKNGDYNFRAEYMSADPYRTLIEGKIWLKNQTLNSRAD